MRDCWPSCSLGSHSKRAHSRIVAGMPPAEFTDATQPRMMNDAINAAMVTLIGEQLLKTLYGVLRQTYQRNVESCSTGPQS